MFISNDLSIFNHCNNNWMSTSFCHQSWMPYRWNKNDGNWHPPSSYHLIIYYHMPHYRNPSLGLVTKAKGLQGCGPKGSPKVKAKRSQRCEPRRSSGVTSHTPKCVRKCEGVWRSEPSHSQSNSHFGRWNPRGLLKFQRASLGVKTQWLLPFFISLKSSSNVDV